MEHLDSRESDLGSSEYTIIGGTSCDALPENGSREACEYTLIGGRACNLTRQPSSLLNVAPGRDREGPDLLFSPTHRCCRNRGRRNSSFKIGSSSSSIEEGGGGGSRCGSGLSLGDCCSVLRWDEKDVLAWLSEIGMECYEVRVALTYDCCLGCVDFAPGSYYLLKKSAPAGTRTTQIENSTG